MLEIVGWIGAIAFAICGAPQAYQSFRRGHSRGINWSFLNLWLIGEICTLIYVIPTGSVPLIFNYVWNLIFILIIMWFKLFERKSLT